MNIRIFKGFAGLTPCCLSVVSDSVFRITSDLSAGGLMLPKCWIQMKGRCDDLHWLDSGGSQVSHLLPAHSGGTRAPAGRKESICWRFGSSNCQKSRWTCLHWAVYRSKCITCHADRVKDFSSVCSDIPFIGESERALFADWTFFQRWKILSGDMKNSDHLLCVCAAASGLWIPLFMAKKVNTGETLQEKIRISVWGDCAH